MGKLPFVYTDSEETEDTSSSVENVKKKKFSILKHSTNGNAKKKKCKIHSISEPEDSELRSRTNSNHKVHKLRGILKHDRERESSEDDDDVDSVSLPARERCLVGRVPRPPGARPGRGGGVAIVVRKNTGLAGLQSLQPQSSSSSSTKKRRSAKRLARKRSY